MTTYLPVRDTDPETSRVAALTDRSHDRRLILLVLDGWGDSTADEVADRLDFQFTVRRHRSAVCSRLRELELHGYVWPTEERRKSPAGRNVIVWSITPEGREAVR